jgi:tetratricopeptide (TPR) repeat protein
MRAMREHRRNSLAKFPPIRIPGRVPKTVEGRSQQFKQQTEDQMKIKHFLSVIALLSFAALTAAAQTGRLEGDVVKADTKEPVVGAEVQIERTDIKGSYPVKTDKKGHFLHAGVPYTGTYNVIVSAPGCEPQFLTGIRGSNQEPLKFELRAGDGRKLTPADVKGMQAGAPKGGAPQMSAADQKKAMEEYNKKREEVDAKNKKASEEHEAMKKLFEQGQQLASNKDYAGAINAYNEASKLDAEQTAIWANLALAYYNRGVTNYNESTKDMSKRDPAKQDFNDAVNVIGKALALIEPQLADPAKGAEAKKQKAQYTKIKADAEGLLAKRLGVIEMADPAVKDYRQVADLSDAPADKTKFQLAAAEVYFDSGKAEEAVAAYMSILETSPDNLDAIYKLGLAYASVAKFQESANTFQKFLDKAPESDGRVTEVKAVLKDLVVGNNLQPPKSEPDKKKPAPARKKP